MLDKPLTNGKKPTDEQFQAAVCAAPYIHARLAATTLKATVTPLPALPYNPGKLTPEQREFLQDILLIAAPTIATAE